MVSDRVLSTEWEFSQRSVKKCKENEKDIQKQQSRNKKEELNCSRQQELAFKDFERWHKLHKFTNKKGVVTGNSEVILCIMLISLKT